MIHKKAQIGTTMVWMFAFLIILFILFIYFLAVSWLFAPSALKGIFKDQGASIGYEEGSDLAHQSEIIGFSNANKPLISDWADDPYIQGPDNLGEKEYTELCQAMKNCINLSNGKIFDLCLEVTIEQKIKKIAFSSSNPQDCAIPLAPTQHCMTPEAEELYKRGDINGIVVYVFSNQGKLIKIFSQKNVAE
jgi:hypothetical protein